MSTMEPMKTAESMFQEDIAKIEVGIKRLKVHYDMFFVGALSREPYEIRAQLERLIRRLNQEPNLKYAQRFQFNALVSRFNSLSELWAKTTRKMEEGDNRNRTQLDQFGLRERLIARARISAQSAGDGHLKRLYRKFTEARRANGQEDRPLAYERFVRGISSQTEKLRKESGCAEIELRVVLRDQKVQIKARPGN
jgi:hypothetical protein